MATPHNAPHKKLQRELKAAVKNRGEVLWRSNVILQVDGHHYPKDSEGKAPSTLIKRQLQGTYVRALHGPPTKEC